MMSQPLFSCGNEEKMTLTVFQRELKIYHDPVNLGKGLRLKENSNITAWETNYTLQGDWAAER